MQQNTLKFGNLNIYISTVSRTSDRGPEPTNAPYGIAKKAISVMLEAYYRQYGMKNVVLVPVNLFGPGGNFAPETRHMIPALIRKCEKARIRGDKEIVCWGTGKATREFLYADDADEGVIRAAKRIEEPIPIILGDARKSQTLIWLS